MEFFDALNVLSRVVDVEAPSDFSIKDLLTGPWTLFVAWAEKWRQTLDPAIWLISAILALIPGSFAIYKWWFYRNSRLPQRLEELLDLEEARFRRARSLLVAQI